MPVKAFTDRWLKSVELFDKTTEFVDQACPNLWVRIGKRRKSFSVLIGPASHRRRLPIGLYPAVSLAEASAKAAEILSDPRASRGSRPTQGGKSRRGSVKDLFEFVVRSMEVEGKVASISDYKLYLLDGVDAAVKEFGPNMPASAVTPEMVTAWLARFHRRGKSTRLPRAVISAAFNRGIKADNDPTSTKNIAIKFALNENPVASVGGPTQSQVRDRFLSFEELACFWADLEADPFSSDLKNAMRLIISMGGVRITEVLRSEKDWWHDDGGWRSLRAGRLALPKTKNGRPHDLPITTWGARLLKDARLAALIDSSYLFPSPFNPKAPRTFDTLSRAVHKYCAITGVKPFTPRDIRRTMKTLLLDNDVTQVDVDIWHNHGRNADVARRNYDRAEYEQAKGRVMNSIDRLISELT